MTLNHHDRPVHLIITTMKWIRTSKLSIKKSLSKSVHVQVSAGGQLTLVSYMVQLTLVLYMTASHISPASRTGLETKSFRFRVGSILVDPMPPTVSFRVPPEPRISYPSFLLALQVVEGP